MTSVRINSMTIGVLILSAFLLYGVGQSMVSTAPTIAIFMITLNSGVVVTIGILFKSLLITLDKSIINTYLAARVIEATLLLIGGTFLYFNELSDSAFIQQSAMAINKVAYNIAMISLGIGSTIVFYFSLKPRVFPVWICIWGLIGYTTLIIGSLLDIADFAFSMYFLAPGGLFEAALSLWLIFKGHQAAIA